MKQVPALLTGSIFIFLTLFTSIGIADEPFDSIYFSIVSKVLDLAYYPEPDNADHLFDGTHSESSFLLSHKISTHYTFGFNYADLNVSNNLRSQNNNSKLWFMLQFKF